jgi:hypothetical protein
MTEHTSTVLEKVDTTLPAFFALAPFTGAVLEHMTLQYT